MFMNYMILFGAFPDSIPPLCHLASTFGAPSPSHPTHHLEDVIHEQTNEIMLKVYFARHNNT